MYDKYGGLDKKVERLIEVKERYNLKLKIFTLKITFKFPM